VPDFPDVFEPGDLYTQFIGTLSRTGIMGAFTSSSPASTAWPSANLAIIVPIRIPRKVTVYKMSAGCGATAGGNFDVGIYDHFFRRIVSTGSTARATSSEVIVDVTDTEIGPGQYYLAMSVDGTSNIVCIAQTNLAMIKLLGVMIQTSAFALPSTLTPVTPTTGIFAIPMVGAYLRST
jgi:hypothetical protein